MSPARTDSAILVQPPFVQLNAPYPAVHYLEAYLRAKGLEAEAFDHSISLYRRIFSRRGLEKAFAQARERLALGGKIGGSAAFRLDKNARSQVDRYLSYEPLYLEWIEGIMDFLAGKDPAMAHRLAQAAELPRGERAQAFLEQREGRIGAEESGVLATKILEDLGDFISFVLDPEFGTVRYGERISSSRADFDQVRSALDTSWLLKEFYEPYLEGFWAERIGAAANAGRRIGLVLISIPFPGALLGALACAAAARRAFGRGGGREEGGAQEGLPKIVFGGGYVSTELRGLRDAGIFDFCDYLTFDAGYGGLSSILSEDPQPYRTMYRDGSGKLVVSGFPKDDSAREGRQGPGFAVIDSPFEAERRKEEVQAIRTVFPDYRGADYASYLRIVDSGNPMHRLWSDTPWLKYSLAHGCYWKKCAFCDTELEYVADFSRSSVQALVAAAEKARAAHGLSGIHFVDEAMPMAALLEFAAANRALEKPFSFWGNVRFDSSWTQGRCEYLAACGLVAVSGGIEIATERGLAMTDKGFDLSSLVETLVAMKRAGLLVHTYLIYGFPGQEEGDILESAEFCRQLFASGLVDSAFWHRFVLTRHSRMYGEWKEGRRPGLEPLDKPWTFANNDLDFEGSGKFDRYDGFLSSSLSAWMEGKELDEPLFDLQPDYVETLIARAEERLDAARPSPGSRLLWVAGSPFVEAAAPRKAERSSGSQGSARLRWAYRGALEDYTLPLGKIEALANLLSSGEMRRSGLGAGEFMQATGLTLSQLAPLLAAGLVWI